MLDAGADGQPPSTVCRSAILVPVEDSGSAVELLDQTLQQALSQRASDIHFEPAEHTYRIRLRVDGVLHALPLIPGALANTLTARLKVFGNLDIAERRLPQDGQFSTTLNRMSRFALPPCRADTAKNRTEVVASGESGTRPSSARNDPPQLAQFQQALNKPQGLLLVTGPTGSGKTVTLYSALQARNKPEINLAAWKIRLRSRLLA
jgi:protein transport protein HofB